jgi:hypothetical protein
MDIMWVHRKRLTVRAVRARLAEISAQGVSGWRKQTRAYSCNNCKLFKIKWRNLFQNLQHTKKGQANETCNKNIFFLHMLSSMAGRNAKGHNAFWKINGKFILWLIKFSSFIIFLYFLPNFLVPLLVSPVLIHLPISYFYLHHVKTD